MRKNKHIFILTILPMSDFLLLAINRRFVHKHIADIQIYRLGILLLCSNALCANKIYQDSLLLK